MSNLFTFNVNINTNTPAIHNLNNVVQEVKEDKTMTSREIAEMVDSRHDVVKKSIKRLTDRKVIGEPPLVEYPDSLGRPAQEYVFRGEQGKRDSIVVIAQLSPEFTGNLVDRWMELERQLVSPEHLLKNDKFVKAYINAQTDQLEQASSIIEEHLHNLTVDEWRSLHHKYMSRRERQQLGVKASKMCRDEKIPIGKQTRSIKTKDGESYEGVVNIYPKQILDEAAYQLGIAA